MDIMVGLDRGLVKQLGVLMISAYENHKELVAHADDGVIFWVFEDELIDSDRQFLSAIAAGYGQKVNYVHVDRTRYEYFAIGKHWSQAAAERWPIASFYHLLVHDYLPETVHRALVLDIDVVIDGNIEEFYNLDFEDRPIIVSYSENKAEREPEREFDKFIYGEDIFKEGETLKYGKLYFNSGVMLYNLDKLREYGINEKYYKKVVDKFEFGITDERIANHCFAGNGKFLTTTKYNYRMSIAQTGFYAYKNRVKNIEPEYKFYELDAKIIHYGGMLTHCKPWFLNFNYGEIKRESEEYFYLLPEIGKIFPIWWKYAALLPDKDYKEFMFKAEVNKAAYTMFKKLTTGYRDVFFNTLGLETLYVGADSWGLNDINPGNNLNDFVKPKVYRCADGKTKEKVKNIPAEFVQSAGFRLTVKYIAANAGENTAVLQILEPNTPDAAVYRRYGHRHGKDWSKWYKRATTDDIETAIKAYYGAKANQSSNVARQLEDIKNSFSYKIGRFITWLPRKIRGAFKK